ncbi:MAG: hypothetical protein U5K77_03635 [Candidatus Saccharibacteria bacterium]|nr:hypothetical protein [Candidatus Saccharibacteria bacterium]
METLKSIGGSLLGIVIFIGIIVATVLLFTLGARVAFTIQPFVNWLTGILLTINIITLLIAIAPKARGVAGIIIFISSYVYGLNAWIFGLAVTLALWGWIAVIIGLFLGGVGVVPIGMLASALNGHWEIFWTLILAVFLTYGARIIGALLAESSEKAEEDADVIDLEPEKAKRTWRDIE